jgi:hypothetical protein
MKKFICVLILLFGGVVVLGCDSEVVDTYDLEVTWTLGGSADCRISFQGDIVDIDSIRIRIFESEKDALAQKNETEDVTVLCAMGSNTMRRLEGGKYWMLVQGIGTIDNQALPLYDSLSEVRVPAENDRVRVSLTQAEGAINVTWGFASMLTCGFDKPNEVAEIEILSAESARVPCVDGQYTISDIIANNYSVELNALNAAGDVIGTIETDEPFLVLPGQTYNARLIFE